MNALYLNLNRPPRYLCSSMRKFLPDEHHVNRTTNDSVLILMFDGVLRFEEDGEPQDLCKGEYYIQRGGRVQTGERASSSPEYFYIHFDGIFSPHSENGEQSAELPLHGKFDAFTIQPYIKKLTRLGHRATATEYACAFYEILTALMSRREVTLPERIREYIVENSSRPFSLNELSRLFYVSKNKLIELFRNAYGTTPYAYYNEYRLSQARLLVLSADLPLSRVAEAAGFGDYMTFYKAYVKRFGISPFVMRKTHRR